MSSDLQRQKAGPVIEFSRRDKVPESLRLAEFAT